MGLSDGFSTAIYFPPSFTRFIDKPHNSRYIQLHIWLLVRHLVALPSSSGEVGA